MPPRPGSRAKRNASRAGGPRGSSKRSRTISKHRKYRTPRRRCGAAIATWATAWGKSTTSRLSPATCPLARVKLKAPTATSCNNASNAPALGVAHHQRRAHDRSTHLPRQRPMENLLSQTTKSRRMNTRPISVLNRIRVNNASCIETLVRRLNPDALTQDFRGPPPPKACAETILTGKSRQRSGCTQKHS